MQSSSLSSVNKVNKKKKWKKMSKQCAGVNEFWFEICKVCIVVVVQKCGTPIELKNNTPNSTSNTLFSDYFFISSFTERPYKAAAKAGNISNRSKTVSTYSIVHDPGLGARQSCKFWQSKDVLRAYHYISLLFFYFILF